MLRTWAIPSTNSITNDSQSTSSELRDDSDIPIGDILAFDFDGVDSGTTTPVLITSDRVTATITANSLAGPGALEAIEASELLLATAGQNVLYEAAGMTGSSINISFSKPLSQLSHLYFATKDAKPVGDEVVLEAYLGTELVGTTTARGTMPQGGVYTEGELYFAGSIFDSLVISISPDGDLSELAIGGFEVALLPDDADLPLVFAGPVDEDRVVNTSNVTVSGQLQSVYALDADITYMLDGQSAGTAPVVFGTRTSAGTFEIELLDVTEGSHTLSITGGDLNGNTSDTTITFVVDLTLPTLAIDPIGLDWLIGSDSVTVTGATGDTFAVGDTLLYSLDDGELGTVLVAIDVDPTSGTFAIDLAEIGTGEHSLTVTAFDKAGNQVELTTTFTYDATPPSVDVLIENEGFSNQTGLVFAGTVSDVFGLAESIFYSLDGFPAVAVVLDHDAGGTAGTFSIATSGLAEGSHTLDVTVTDLVGNTASETFTFFVDLTAPLLAFDPIGNQGYLHRTPITGTFTDETRLFTTYQYAFDGGALVEVPLLLSGDSTAGNFTIATTGLADGSHTLTVSGRDHAGNEVEETVAFTIDTVGPIPVSFAPEGTLIGGDYRELSIFLGEDRIVPDQVTDASNWVLEGSGGDAVFGDANAFVIPIFDDQITYDEIARRVEITLPAPLVEDYYRLTIKGTGPAVIHDLAGNPINDGEDYVHEFVLLDLPAVLREPDVTFEAGTKPVDLVAVDLDGNGLDDLVAVDLASGVLTVAINNGSTVWESVEAIDLGLGPIHGLAAGDFNEDGKPDLLLQGPTNVFLATGDGAGQFAVEQTLSPAGLAEPSNQTRIGLLAADLTGDGHLDAVVLVTTTGEVLVYAGDGTGAFADPQAYATGGQDPVDLAVANYIGDESLDLAIAHRADGSVTFLEGNGQRGFVLNADFTVTGLGPINSLETADFNTDGREDLAVAASPNAFVLVNTTGEIRIVPLANGAFDDGLTAWTSETSQTLLEAGAVEVIDGVAVFQEGAAGRVTLAQGLVVPAGATMLSFDLIDNGLETPEAGRLPDAFEVSLLDAAGQSLLPAIGANLTAYSNFAPDGTTLLGSAVSIDGHRVTLDLTSIGTDTEATLYLDLVASGPGAGSTVSVDNFAVLVPPVLTHEFMAGSLAGPVDVARGIVAADVDGDGRTDLLVTDASGRLVVYSGDARGGFARTELDASGFGSGPMAVVVGNLTGGAEPDIAYTLLDSGLVVSPLGVGPEMVDVTDSVEVAYFTTQLERATNTFTFYATVTNTSSQPLSGPIYLAWADLEPATIGILNADGELHDGTPYFDLTSLMGDGILDPGETTSAQVFRSQDPLLEAYSFRTVVMATPTPSGDAPATSDQATASPVISLSATDAEAGTTIVADIVGGPDTVGTWVGLFALGTEDHQYLNWSYLSGSHRGSASTGTDGPITFEVPLASGQYELRVFAANSYVRLAISERFTVYGGDVDPPSVPRIIGFGTDTGQSEEDNLTHDTALEFAWSASGDLSGVVGYWWAVDDDTPENGGTFTTELRATALVHGDGNHVFYVRAVDGSPSANVSAPASFAFSIDTTSPRVESAEPRDGRSLAAGPRTIELRFSESMDFSAGTLATSGLVLSGPGVGQVSVTDAAWIDDRTVRYSIDGQWGTGPVTVELHNGTLFDVAGNPVSGYLGQFRIDETATPLLDVSADRVNGGGSVQVALSNGPGRPEDIVALFEVGSDDDTPIDWLYSNGTKLLADTGVADAQLTFTAPLYGGRYEFRLLSDGQVLAVSTAFQVTEVEIFLDFDGGYLPDLAGIVEVDGSTGISHSAFVPYGEQDRQIQAPRQNSWVDFVAWTHNP